jgi:hypothetical protein
MPQPAGRHADPFSMVGNPLPTSFAGGVSIKELAEYLGHSDPAFTLRVYAHMLPCSHDRARAVITERFTRMMGTS